MFKRQNNMQNAKECLTSKIWVEETENVCVLKGTYKNFALTNVFKTQPTLNLYQVTKILDLCLNYYLKAKLKIFLIVQICKIIAQDEFGGANSNTSILLSNLDIIADTSRIQFSCIRNFNEKPQSTVFCCWNWKTELLEIYAVLDLSTNNQRFNLPKIIRQVSATYTVLTGSGLNLETVGSYLEQNHSIIRFTIRHQVTVPLELNIAGFSCHRDIK